MGCCSTVGEAFAEASIRQEGKAMSERLACIVPFCKRTRKPYSDEPEEWICDRHYKAIPLPMRREYEAAWADADAADKRKSDDWSIYRRVTDAFEHCKAEALKRAMESA
jgi:hypothetical protein